MSRAGVCPGVVFRSAAPAPPAATQPPAAEQRDEIAPASAIWKTIGIVVVPAFGRKCSNDTTSGNYSHLSANQVGDQGRQSIVLAIRKAILNRQVLALDVATVFQSLPEGDHADFLGLAPFGAEPTDHQLLRTRRNRPRNRACKSRNEVAPFHGATPDRARLGCHRWRRVSLQQS